MRRTRPLAIVAIVALALAPPAALAQSPGAGQSVGVEITPSRLEVDLPGKSVSVRMLLVNHEASPRRVHLSITGLGHDLDGTPRFLDPDPASAALAPSIRDLVLQPGARQEFVVSGAIPSDRPALYAAVVAEFEPLQRPTGQVEVRTRVAGLLLLRGPRPWIETARVVDVGILPGAPGGPVTVYAAVEDTGNVHIRPTGSVRIFKGDTLLDTVRLTGQTILPGFARRLTGQWTPPPGLTGRLRLVASIRNPDAEGTGTADFNAGVVRFAAASIEDLVAEDDGGAVVRLSLRNTGTADVGPTVELTATEGSFERARASLVQPSIAPGERRAVTWRPDLAPGEYLIKVRALDGDTVLDQEVVGLRVGGGRGLAWMWYLIALLALLIVAMLLYRERRRRAARGKDPLPT